MDEHNSVDGLLEKLKELAFNSYPEVVVDAEIIYGKYKDIPH